MSRLAWKIVLPLLVVGCGATALVALVRLRPQPATRIPEPPLPVVRVLDVELQDVQLRVRSQGTVGPRTETVLVGEVAGKVVEVAPSFASGGFFEAGDVLLRIDALDYREALVQARAALAGAQLRLERERAEADVARREWRELGAGEPTRLTLREPQLAEAEAAVAAADAAVERAERNLERTRIRAPYAGRVRRKEVDVGQYVAPGTALATVYAVDYFEVRLPVADSELAFVDVPLDYRDGDERGTEPEVILRADFAGRTHEWSGRVVRTEGEIDPRTRSVHLVARVSDPYAHGDAPDRPPLAAGMFVRAEILGRRVEGVVIVPRAALRDDDTLLVVDAEDRLRLRRVQVLRASGDELIVSAGLAPGERVCLSPLAVVTDGMRVRTAAGAAQERP